MINVMVNLKQLFESKRKYYEAERVYGKHIYDFIKDTYERMNDKSLPKSCGLRINFEECGKYSSPELVISGDVRLLTDEIIGAVISEYDLLVTYKCISTGLDVRNNHITQKAKVYFSHNWEDDPFNKDGYVDVVNNITIEYNNGKGSVNE